MNREELVAELQAKFTLDSEQAVNLAEFLEGEDELDCDVEEIVFSFYMDNGHNVAGIGDHQEWIFNLLSRELDL